MLFKQITLQNFRQFKDKVTITFSTDSQKNVTIIMGENGTGKTSLEQAFTWCLYNKTAFKDEDIFSKASKPEMQIGQKKDTFVELVFTHGSVEYTLRRTMTYQMQSDGRTVKAKSGECKLSYLESDGQTKTIVHDGMIKRKIDGILPEDLSKYFLFDGERVERIGDEIQSGKSDEFAAAVRRILGLDTYVNALKHLDHDPKSGNTKKNKYTVYAKLTSDFSDVGNNKLKEINSEIEKLEQQLADRQSRIAELESEKPKYSEERDSLIAQIERNKNSESLMQQKKKLEEERDRLTSKIDSATATVFGYFSKNYLNFFIQRLTADAVSMLASSDYSEKTVPFINDKTIAFLLKHRRCLCGAEIAENSEAEQELKMLLDYIPPKSVGNMVDSYIAESRTRINNSQDLYEYVCEQLREIDRSSDRLEEITDEIENLEMQLDQMQDIEALRKKLHSLENVIQKNENELTALKIKESDLSKEIGDRQTERDRIAALSENNRKILLYKSYADALYELLKKDYDIQEQEVRSYLQNIINELFYKIYSADLTLEIDEKYNITTRVNDVENLTDSVETSTAQSISVVFAFIVGVIQTAKDFEKDKDDDKKKMSSEAYPLVMDAPLSSFDKKRIQTVCETIPEICEQVIIFIKDTDGEIAHKHMFDKTGSAYTFMKKTSVETEIKEGLNV